MLADPSQGPLKEKHFGSKTAMLPPETLPVMIVCLQQAAQQIALHPEVKEAIVTMMAQAQPFLTRPRQQPPPAAVRDCGAHRAGCRECWHLGGGGVRRAGLRGVLQTVGAFQA